jgi:lambda family phage portal protein
MGELTRAAPPGKVTIVDHNGKPYRAERAPARRATYDAARTSDENRKHWADADDLAAVSQLTTDVRRTLRRRARHECQNNCFAGGVVRTVVADTVGTGARLQMLADDDGLNRAVEDLWRVWSAAADWPLTSRVLCGVELVAGECFGAFRDSKRLDRLGLPVTLDVRLIEPDQVADPAGLFSAGATGDDGIECDEEGDPVAYRVLKRHPGDARAFWSEKADRVDARNMVHWFRPERPGQLRGATQLAPALPIFAQLRRFTSATLTAAEVAAMLAGVLELPDGALGDDEPATYDTMDTIELVRGMLLTVPGGGAVTQFKPEQPTTNYDMFVSAKLREVGRAINMPFGKVAGDHSRYNYSSGRMDDAPYWHDRDIHRQGLEAKVFDPVLYRWFEFAKFALPGLVKYEGAWWKLRHRWQYDARPVFDPVKDASADEINLTNASDTLAAVAARDGVTEEELILARKRTMDLFKRHGLPLPVWLTGGTAAPVRTTDQPQPAEEAARA